ncbi:Ig-like domain-containing protein [Bifidobacterium amazonense]|uniref:Ig-like domain-containing protein n=1 Tax=Bifidobacterium amazonense TaxID=2809027 RepID=A0ABS9VWG1_9BIFI|nr:SpaA isopeptide-forming pilin-related protein [Bifidobacterium amazonense]MCH9276445.1 Ig-like domain-containing protein [Bifidobacterium amazonense]
MMLGTALTGIITSPIAAYADNGFADGAFAETTTQSMGTEANPSKDRDPSAATWVGGDMFVGKRPANSTVNDSSQNNLMNANGPDGSYAVEAEGLTVVNGKLLLNPLKNSWAKINEGGITGGGFRFGIVGFGTQFRPAEGSTALVVGGNSDTVIDSGSGATAKVKAWTRSGFIKGHSHQASLAGSKSGVWNHDNYDSIRQEDGASVSWNAPDDNLDNVSVKTADNSEATTKKFSEENFWQDYVVDDISEPLSHLTATGTVSVDKADTNTVTRHKYNNSSVNYNFNYNDDTKTGTGRGIANGEEYTNREKLITFTGSGTASMEVFTLNASDLSDYIGGTRYRGIAFKFENIADDASIVINVKPDATNKNISFHTGWKFYWGNTQISDGYFDGATQEVKSLYAKAAQKILWNFYDTDNLTIYGGVANEDGSDNTKKITQDDPAAAMMGSIIVKSESSNTNGNFESHVSTNGRVYTEGDFSMYNPYVAWNFTGNLFDGNSSSVLDMDQERHNFPWNGSYKPSGASIKWSKSDADGKSLGGTTWSVYGTYAEAVKANGTPILTVTDNGYYDADKSDGEFQIDGLKTNATYYIKEVSAGTGYQLNTNIYYVATGNASSASTVTQSVTQTNGTFQYGTADMTDNKIINRTSGREVAWKKVDDSTKELLEGSAWQIKRTDTGAAETDVWNVTDATGAQAATGVTIASDTTELAVGGSATLTAKVTPDNASQKVTWKFVDENGADTTPSNAQLSPKDDSSATIVSPSGSTAGTVYVVACSVSNTSVCSDKKQIDVKIVSAQSLTVTDSSDVEVTDGTAITVAQGDQLSYTATVSPTTVPISWSSSNDSVATVDSKQSSGTSTATVTMHAIGSATITVTAGDKKVSFTVTTPSTTVYFKKSLVNWSNYYLYYDGGGSEWQFAQMTGTCGDYVYVTIPKATSGKNFLLRDRASKDGSDGWFKGNGGSNFTFTGNMVQVVEAYNNFQGLTAPSGCTATAAASAATAADVASAQSDETAADDDSVGSDDWSDGEAAVSPIADETAGEAVDETDASQSGDVADGQSEAVTAAGKAASCTASDGTVSDGKVMPGVKCDVDTVAGQFKVDGLEAGTYLLHEITAPDGYTINKTVYQFTIDGNGNVTWDGGWPSEDDVTDQSQFDTQLTPGTDNAIGDTPTEITWYKVSSTDTSDTPKYLKGAQWKLTLKATTTDGTDTVYCVVDGNGAVANKSDGGTTCDGTQLDDLDPKSGKRTTESDGIIYLKGLKFGTYTLVETVAPEGYDLSKTVYTFTIKDSTTGTVQIYRPAAAASSVSSDAMAEGGSLSDSGIMPLSSDEEEPVTGNKIPNTPGVELPATGGEGSTFLLRSGAVMVIMAALGLAFMARRRRS